MQTQETVEWPDQVEVLVERLESEATERALNREERALMDVYETVPILERRTACTSSGRARSINSG